MCYQCETCQTALHCSIQVNRWHNLSMGFHVGGTPASVGMLTTLARLVAPLASKRSSVSWCHLCFRTPPVFQVATCLTTFLHQHLELQCCWPMWTHQHLGSQLLLTLIIGAGAFISASSIAAQHAGEDQHHRAHDSCTVCQSSGMSTVLGLLNHLHRVCIDIPKGS